MPGAATKKKGIKAKDNRPVLMYYNKQSSDRK